MDTYEPNQPKRVVVDRYRKKIREEDANRAESNYAKAALAGSLAGLAARLKAHGGPIKASHRALIGAGAGLVAEGITRAAGASTKDFYGERTRVAKKSEKIPAYAGLGIAGGLAYQRLKKKFESGTQETRMTEFGWSTFRQAQQHVLKKHGSPDKLLFSAPPGFLGSKLVRFDSPDRPKKDYIHDMLTGGLEGAAGVLATDSLIHGRGGLYHRLRQVRDTLRFPIQNQLPRKLLIGGGVGAVATGAIGAGVSAVQNARQRKRDQNVWLARRFKATEFERTSPGGSYRIIEDLIGRRFKRLGSGGKALNSSPEAMRLREAHLVAIRKMRAEGLRGHPDIVGEPATRDQIRRAGYHIPGGVYDSSLPANVKVNQREQDALRRKWGFLAARFKEITEFRSLRQGDEEDLRNSRRKLAVYAGGALAAAGGLALLAKRPAGVAVAATKAAVRPAGRGTLERIGAANALRDERGYVHLRPMMPGQRKRFDKLPTEVQARVGRYSSLATNPNLSSEEQRKFRQAVGKLRVKHNFSRGDDNEQGKLRRIARKITGGAIAAGSLLAVARAAQGWGIVGKSTAKVVGRVTRDKLDEMSLLRQARRILRNPPHELSSATPATEFAAFIKDVPFKSLPAETRKNIRAFHPDVKPDDVLVHYGMVPKELALKADPHNLATARRQVCDRTPLACRREVFKRRGDKHILVNNDRIEDGHHFLAKAERGKVGGSLHVIDLTPLRFQHLERQFESGNQEARRVLMQVFFPGFLASRLKQTLFISGPAPSNDLPDWVMARQKSEKRRRRIDTASKVAGITGATASVATLVDRLLRRRRNFESGNQKSVSFARQQLRDKSSDRWSDPRMVAIGAQPSYYVGPGNQRINIPDIPVQHAQVLRKVYSDAGKIRRHGSRAVALVKDATDVIAGSPRRTDIYGRPQKREWEKSWFKKAAVDTAIGAAGVGGLIALKKNPKLRSAVLTRASNIKTRVNRAVPDFFAGRKFKSGSQPPGFLIELGRHGFIGPVHHLGRIHSGAGAEFSPGFLDSKFVRSFSAMPNRFGASRTGIGKIDYREQEYVFELARALRNHLRGGKRPAIAGGIARKMPGGKMIPPPGFLASKFNPVHFDQIADFVGWDVRDPRGRSARVFAPPSRPRMRREKEWYEKEENRRKIRAAIAAVAVPSLAVSGALVGRRYFPIKPKPTAVSNILPFRPHNIA